MTRPSLSRAPLHPAHCHCWHCSDDPALRRRTAPPLGGRVRTPRLTDHLSAAVLALLALAVAVSPLFTRPLP